MALEARVLVAEDNPVNQVVVRRLLERIGCVVDVASNGREAVERVRENSYDLVLMDCDMPEMDGYQATRAIRGLDGEIRSLPIIALTASAMRGDRDQCLEAGMDDYLSKPVEQEALRGVLARWLSKARAA